MPKITAGDLAGMVAGDAAAKEEWGTEVDHFRLLHAAIGAVTFEQLEPAYHYGWDIAPDLGSSTGCTVVPGSNLS